ncbi:hypothetical protein KCV87_21420 [Actinosynnema pretiosum subsp. pretiosum]|uniref:Uncharacterized protein n=3 Tax=Actinosynnema TaxID=40566 RepID=C6WR13_ACTMD|nr:MULTISPECIES: hypothetical protein [Actinosynnema]ACU40706.1 hypothetical protein Amir_6911 [Actinosynnema mirum DSM 43827]ATE57729.1 hypothetical protein CNX65_34155 [Actinosynnema pretiosum]AXX34212.1 hypothetical protein APASM_6847 [Actinosynnema pretiosum subsp. pretiosum]QUF02067.1 hypothetical protein KCV87_21420 [Actinosynnema pretiosum subsp. pretiosum]
MADHSSPFVAGPGGVMTDEVGVVTGDLELRTTVGADGKFKAEVRYEGADEWYGVTGGSVAGVDPKSHEAVHALLVGVLNRPEG